MADASGFSGNGRKRQGRETWAAVEAARAAAGKLDLIALAIAALEVEKG